MMPVEDTALEGALWFGSPAGWVEAFYCHAVESSPIVFAIFKDRHRAVKVDFDDSCTFCKSAAAYGSD